MATTEPDQPPARPYAWAVEYGAGRVALFLDRARAEQAAASLHGRLVALLAVDSPKSR